MGITIEERSSDSPYIERVWRSRSDFITSFLSIAVFQWDLVVWTQQGQTQVSIQGPAAQATRAPVPPHAEFFGVLFRPGVYMPHLPGSRLLNTSIDLPVGVNKSFWLHSDTWPIPTYSNVESFVLQLKREGVLEYDPVVAAVMSGHAPDVSLRSVQRRFLHSTGLSYRTMHQIERARRAALLLRQGVSILDTVYQLNYFDQSHLIKSLRHHIGQTPTQLMGSVEELSLLYKTDSFDGSMMETSDITP